MTWVKLDDKRALNAKLREAGLEARGLDEAAICWAAQMETDGFVSDADVAMIVMAHGAKPGKVTARLVSVGRWTRDDERGGFQIHDYLEFNPSRTQVIAERTEARERMRTLRSQRNGVHPNTP